MTNPIVINSAVVFIRLYWFEKRFQKVVRDARSLRRLRTKSRSKSEARLDRDVDGEERGVGDRQIKVLHTSSASNSEKPDDGKEIERTMSITTAERARSEENKKHKGSDTTLIANTEQATLKEEPAKQQREITFSDEVIRPAIKRVSSLESVRFPTRRTTEQHIAFVENQRNAKDKATLRIPGPRDYDRGSVPQKVTDEDEIHAENDEEEIVRNKFFGRNASAQTNRTVERHVTMDEFDQDIGSKKRKWSYLWNPRRILLGEAFTPNIRARTKSFASMMNTRNDGVDPIPYLSWQPTVGRNSAFIDLTESQREELGGIEYRALKTLAGVLICEGSFQENFHLFISLTPIRLLRWLEYLWPSILFAIYQKA